MRLQTNDSKINIVKSVLNDLLFTVDNINVGLMRFDSSAHGGPVLFPMTDIDIDDGVNNTRDTISAAVDAIVAGGNTPLAETQYEAYRYYAGLTPEYGDDSRPASVASSKTGCTLQLAD